MKVNAHIIRRTALAATLLPDRRDVGDGADRHLHRFRGRRRNAHPGEGGNGAGVRRQSPDVRRWRPAHHRLRQVLAEDRRPARVHLVRRVPSVPAAEPGPVARRAREDEGDGLNAVSLYFDWGYHSPEAGRLRLHRRARRRPAARHRRGGRALRHRASRARTSTPSSTPAASPAGCTTQAGRARTNADDYQAASDEWLSHVNPIIARHQLTDGGGTVILYQIENEYDGTRRRRPDYMEELKATARADGITVPLFHNDKGRNAAAGRAGTGRAGPLRVRHLPGRLRLQPHVIPGSPTTASCATARAFDPDRGRRRRPAVLHGRVPGRLVRPVGRRRLRATAGQLTGPAFERMFYDNNIANQFTRRTST